MIDLHAHILPGLDDGARDAATALAMARGAVADGITAMVATPHYMEGAYRCPREKLLEEVWQFQDLLAREKIPLQIYPGCEAYLEPALLQSLGGGSLLTINDTGKYLLIEFPMQSLPVYASPILYELQLKGLTPIIAHPERNLAIRENPRLLYDFLARGALVQVNASSLRGHFGATAKALAEHFLQLNWVHFLASDAHSAGTRAPVLADALAIAENLLGPKARALVWENPRKVLEGQPVDWESPREYSPPKRGLLARLKKWF